MLGTPALPRRKRKNRILGESENFSSLNETKSLSSILGCEEKTEISNLQELIERSHQLFVSINALMRRLFSETSNKEITKIVF